MKPVGPPLGTLSPGIHPKAVEMLTTTAAQCGSLLKVSGWLLKDVTQLAVDRGEKKQLVWMVFSHGHL